MHHRVLVLNHDYQALSICTVERAFVLVYLRKAEVVETLEGAFLRSVNQIFEMPSIIRLKRYIHMPYRKVSLTRMNIFRRDGNRCLYCGSPHDLTIDHIIPRSKGGGESWDNLATACQSCNTKKGNRSPEEAGMPLIRAPFRPSYIMFLSNFNHTTLNETWRPYLML